MKRWSLNLLAGAAWALAAAALPAQSLNGSVAAADTGAPLVHGTVVAIRKVPTPGQEPAIYKADLDPNGKYAVPVSAGQYQICVSGAEPYLDPCQCGGSPPTPTPSVSDAAVSAPLSLQKGVQLIVRVHDPNRLFRGAESVPGAAVQAHVSAAAARHPLPIVADAGFFRDYGMFIPFNTPLTVFVSSRTLHLASDTGVPLSPAGIPIQISPSDFQSQNPLPPGLARMFPRPTAKVIHVYASALP
jgi:hypothetical protein